jgi:hypothetical protein
VNQTVSLSIKDTIDPLLSGYDIDLPTVPGSVAVATFTGLLHPVDVERLYRNLFVPLSVSSQ